MPPIRRAMLVPLVVLVLAGLLIALRDVSPAPTATSEAHSFERLKIGESATADTGLRPPSPFKLRYDWTKLAPRSQLARRAQRHQQDCSKPRITHFMNNNGMGSDIHQWTVSLCHAMEMGATMLTAPPEKRDGNWDGVWIWEDQAVCSESELKRPLSCYFGEAVTSGRCPGATRKCTHPVDRDCLITSGDNGKGQGSFLKEPEEHICAMGAEWTSAAVEFLFSPLDVRVVDAAEKSIATVFGDVGIPPSMITVHIRWGDKGEEMDLIPIATYVKTVQSLVAEHHLANPAVYVSTEDPDALAAFRAEASEEEWRIFADPMLEQVADLRPGEGNHAVKTAKASKGQEGMHALVSLLLALESQHYVLTTGSNWSQLINELRKTIVDARCAQCAHLKCR